MKNKISKIILIIIISASVIAMFKIAMSRLVIDMDIVESLPKDDPIVNEAAYVINHLPSKDRIIIDLQSSGDIEDLTEGAVFIEKYLSGSGLFKTVGLGDNEALFPELITRITDRLPYLFSEKELEEKIKPLLTREKITSELKQRYLELTSLDSIGQSNLIEKDPLGFRNIILAKLSSLSPSKNAKIYKHQIISTDNRHLLIILEPLSSGTDTGFALKMTSLVKKIESELDKKYSPLKIKYILTPVGSYRAALDNETKAKSDTEKAVLFATIGIALLLIAGFPRPWLGLFALVPALAGTAISLFVYSLFNKSISVLAIGFGGTIISFTVDYGIAYLLFLDRPIKTTGFEATKKVWSLGILAMLTTSISFALLFISGFKALSEIGYFAALGVVFTFAFVHLVYPFIFTEMLPAKKKGFFPLQKFVNKISSGTDRKKFYAACAIGLVLLFFAKPEFKVDLNSMNSVSNETIAAENLVKNTWGDILSRLYIMNSASTFEELQKNSDNITMMIGTDISENNISSGFTSSMVFPGKDLSMKNFEAWKKFFSQKRINEMRNNIYNACNETGFSTDAFDYFFNTVNINKPDYEKTPEKFYNFLSITRTKDNKWMEFSTLTRGDNYKSEKFHDRYRSSGFIKILDPAYFSERIGHSILSAFIKMALIVGAATFIVAFIYLRNIKLVMASLIPTVFALVATFGTLNLIGETIGIAAVVVTIIIIGMGSDYALYLVRAYQKYGNEEDEEYGLIRLTVFLSAASTLIGFGVMSIAEHSMLRHAGIALLLGIIYSYIGAVAITPPLLNIIYKNKK